MNIRDLMNKLDMLEGRRSVPSELPDDERDELDISLLPKAGPEGELDLDTYSVGSDRLSTGGGGGHAPGSSVDNIYAQILRMKRSTSGRIQPIQWGQYIFKIPGRDLNLFVKKYEAADRDEKIAILNRVSNPEAFYKEIGVRKDIKSIPSKRILGRLSDGGDPGDF